MKRGNWMIAGAAGALYLGSVVGGLHVRTLRGFGVSASAGAATVWRARSNDRIPMGEVGQRVRQGQRIFEHTALYAPQYTSSQMSCASCHAAGGIQPFASPLVGVPSLYPRYSQRAGRVISLADRIDECFVRSENGQPPPRDSPAMKAILSYLGWLSRPETERQPFQGQGLALLPRLHGNATRGAAVYAEQCAGCHGRHGQGNAPLYPPLWGPDSFNDGAGMNGVRKMASFVQHNMPQNRMGILTPQQAFDVAAFIHQQRRPHFDPAFSRY